MAAIHSGDGFAIPETRILTDEQLLTLLQKIKDAPIQVAGNPDFCERVERVSKRHGLAVQHSHQVTEEARLEFQKRQDQQQHDEQQQAVFQPH